MALNDQQSHIYERLMDSHFIHVAVLQPVQNDEDFIFIDINKAVEKTEGLKKEDVLEKTLKEIFPSAIDSGLVDLCKKVKQSGITEHLETYCYQDTRASGWRKNEVSLLPNGDLLLIYEDLSERKKIEEDFESFVEIIDKSYNEIYVFDIDTMQFTYVNQGVIQNIGYSYEEMLQKHPADIKPLYSQKELSILLEPLLDGSKTSIAFDTIHQRKDKSTYDIDLRLQLMQIKGSLQVVVIGVNIGEKKQAERALKESEERLANTERVVHFGGWEWDMQTNVVIWSDEVYRIFGEEPQSFESSYEKFASYLNEEDKTRVGTEINLAVEHKRNYDIQYQIFLKDGGTKHIRAIGEAFYDKDEKPLKMVGGLFDITDLAVARDALEEQTEVYARLFHQSTDGMVVYSKDHAVLEYNRAVLDILQINPAEPFLQKQSFEHAPEFQSNGERSNEMLTRLWDKTLSEGSQNFEWQVQQPDGNLIWVHISLMPVTVNHTRRVHSIWRDISQRKALEHELEEFNKTLSQRVQIEIKKNELKSQHMYQQSKLAQMGEMISMIAHQWRQPLSSISAIAGTLSIDIQIDQFKKEFFQDRLKSISDISQHLSSTINDFRNFFKEEKDPVAVDWKKLTENSLHLLSPVLLEHNISIEKEFTHNSEVHTYQNEVMQVLLNIIKNAQDAFIEKGILSAEISIKSHEHKGLSYLRIEDNAGGIPEEIMERIFDPYFSTKTKKDGTGLGLYMSKMIIEEHCQGSLHCENSANGAIFTLGLPLPAQV